MLSPGRRNTKKAMQKLRFNSSLYSKDSIRKTVGAFSHLAEFKLKQKNGYFEIEIENINPDAREVLADEFSNYALGLTKKCS